MIRDTSLAGFCMGIPSGSFATLLVLCSLAGPSLSAPAASGYCTAPKLGTRGGPQHIEIISNKPFVHVRFNGSKPLHFVLDAGSSFTLLNTGVPQTVGFSVASETTREGGFVVRTYTPKACVGVLGVTVPDIEIGDIELDHVSAVEGTRVDGLVGGELFSKYVV